MMIKDWERYVSIDGEGYRLGIQIIQYTYPSSNDINDANWLSARIHMNAGAGRCTVKMDAYIETVDLVAFHKELESMLDTGEGKAKFDSLEECIRFEMELSETGKIQITGEVNEISREYAVQFEFQSDQTFALITRNELAEAIRTFPFRKPV